jgi:hypothetical protein
VIYVTPSQPLYYGPAPTSQNIDITGTGGTNFVLVCDGVGGVQLYPQRSNSMVVAPLPNGGSLDAGYSLVAALNQGDVIGCNPSAIQSGDQWFNVATSPINYSEIGDEVTIDNQIATSSYFVGLATAYIGFELVQNGATNYGWMEVGNPYPLVAGQIVEWAYATTPNTPIVAGAGLLAPLAAPQIVRPGNLRLNWQSQVGQPYQVQFKNQVDAPCWSNLDLTIIASATNALADVPIVGTARFYRVIQVP